MRYLPSYLIPLTLIVVLAPPITAQQDPSDTDSVDDSVSIHVLEPLVVEGRLDDLTGSAASASQGVVGYRDLRLRPLAREGEILETVPGMIMTQHSGDGKSNQMFVRGFNLDHGTDFSTRVEGMQVNIPTHAHGQGYTDLNFVIPELVDHVEYRLGTYYADVGDFGSAGSAELRLRRSLEEPLFSAGLGEDGYRRVVAAGSGGLGPGELVAGGELKQYDGPWALPQDLRKMSGMARYSWESEGNLFSLLALGYDNAWDASDQVPRRLVRSGAVDRFSQVDSTLGGASSRASLSGTWMREASGSSQRLDLHAIAYDLNLYSNFTYFLDDPERGDQIQQEDDGRSILGGRFAHVQRMDRHTVTAGVQARLDLLDVALRDTDEREPVGTVRSDEVTQWSVAGFAEVDTEWGSLLRTILGLRADRYAFDVTSALPPNSGHETEAIVSPKASLIFAPGDQTEVYASAGLGFHSNDARGIVQSIDPVSGDSVDAVDPLVRSRGAEVGLRTTPARGWRSTLSGWWVGLDSELLFVGDAGTTEPSHASRRIGATWANFFRVLPGLTTDLDVSFSRARFPNGPRGERHVPGALARVVTAGLTWEPGERGPYASLRVRGFGEYPLTEDDAVRAPSTTLVNLGTGWALGALRIGIDVLNLLDAEDADIQYFYASRRPGEPAAGVEDVHFHPVEPRQLRLTLSWGQ